MVIRAMIRATFQAILRATTQPQRNVVYGAKQDGGVGMSMKSITAAHINCVIAVGLNVLFACLPEFVNADDDQSPKVSLEPSTNTFKVPICHRITDDVETRVLEMSRLPQPVAKRGQLYEWKIGNDSGLTYWHRTALANGGYEIALYFSAIDLPIHIEATTIYSQRSGHSDFSVTPLPKPGDWEPGTWFYLSDRTTGKTLHVSYLHRSVEDLADYFLPRPQDANAKIELIEFGFLDQTCTPEHVVPGG